MSRGSKPLKEGVQTCAFGWPTNNNYWSSTTNTSSNHYNVNLNNGNVNNNNDSNHNYVGCVRAVNAKPLHSIEFKLGLYVLIRKKVI
ncbi:DUF823 domain-containing adhesin [Vibrio sp. YMD68]|uniref:adhesion domain-containing protein n=1 Tax=Vibrio sp. YMD68 TaxID=3042300 RepID=UPI00249C5468|nr:DUF823 domain-containing adhesin [Vibrio sp. YMD68]WGW01370.1 DUF823 domain-containing adhesin [Vibrio sp. YMD68]